VYKRQFFWLVYYFYRDFICCWSRRAVRIHLVSWFCTKTKSRGSCGARTFGLIISSWSRNYSPCCFVFVHLWRCTKTVMRSFLRNQLWRWIVSPRPRYFLIMMILWSTCNPILWCWVIQLRRIHPRSRVWVLSAKRSSWLSSNFILRSLLQHVWCIWVISPCSRSTLLVFVHLSCLWPCSKSVFRWLNFIN